MCCRLTVFPLHEEIAATILAVGLFKPTGTEDNGIARVWQRYIEEENATVRATIASGCLTLNISPAISTYDHHAGKRVTAGVYFEIAAKYAEKVGGEIKQCATVLGCRAEGPDSELVLARYPSMPMSFGRICQGFQELWLKEL